MSSASVVAVFGFLVWRTGVNTIRRRLARLREPRYVVGAVIGGLYAYFMVFRWLFPGHSGADPGSTRMSSDLRWAISLAAATSLGWMASLTWLLGGGRPRLMLSEAEVQFLAPAPLPRRALLHFTLLRSQLAILVSALVMGVMFGRRLDPNGWSIVPAFWILLSTIQLHALGVSFWHAALAERPAAHRRVVRAVTGIAALLVLLALLAWLLEGGRIVLQLMGHGSSPSQAELLPALLPWASGWVPRVLLLPFRALVAPASAAEGKTFLQALPAALALLAVHYVWVVRIKVRYEEAVLEGARRTAERVDRARSGRLRALPSESRRRIVPFDLPAQGIPEVALLWKNLLGRARSRLSHMALWWATGCTVLFVAAAALGAAGPVWQGPLLVVRLGLAMVAGLLALVLPMGYRNDFREDLVQAAVLRSWPLHPARVAAAELAAPLLLSVVAIEGLLAGALAVQAGARIGEAWGGGVLPMAVGVEGLSSSGWETPGFLALALLLPALAAGVLVIQNAAVLSFPAWFPPGPQRQGLENSGMRMVGFLGTNVILVLALVPAAVMSAPVAWLAWKLVGAWCLLPAALAGSLPIWLEVGVGLALLGRLFERFDVSSEAWSQ